MKELLLFGVSVLLLWVTLGASTTVAADTIIFKKVDFSPRRAMKRRSGTRG